MKESNRERQIPYDFAHLWNLNKTDEHRGGGEEKRGKQTTRDS